MPPTDPLSYQSPHLLWVVDWAWLVWGRLNGTCLDPLWTASVPAGEIPYGQPLSQLVSTGWNAIVGRRVGNLASTIILN